MDHENSQNILMIPKTLLGMQGTSFTGLRGLIGWRQLPLEHESVSR